MRRAAEVLGLPARDGAGGLAETALSPLSLLEIREQHRQIPDGGVVSGAQGPLGRLLERPVALLGHQTPSLARSVSASTGTVRAGVGAALVAWIADEDEQQCPGPARR